MHIVTSKVLSVRRRFLRQLAAGGAFYTVAGLYAEALTLTPAKGLVSYVSGRVLDAKGKPVKGALVELSPADDGGNTSLTPARRAVRNQILILPVLGSFLSGRPGNIRFGPSRPACIKDGRTNYPARGMAKTRLYTA